MDSKSPGDFLLKGCQDIQLYLQLISNPLSWFIRKWLCSNAYAYLTKHWTFLKNKTNSAREKKRKWHKFLGKVFVLIFYEYIYTKETIILVRGFCRKYLRGLYKIRMAMWNNSMGFHSAIAFTTLNICPFNASLDDDWIDQKPGTGWWRDCLWSDPTRHSHTL